MKDYKPKVINVTNNIRATIYQDGDFDISFLYDENRRWDFEFSKYNRIKQRVCTDGKTFKPITSQKEVLRNRPKCPSYGLRHTAIPIEVLMRSP